MLGWLHHLLAMDGDGPDQLDDPAAEQLFEALDHLGTRDLLLITAAIGRPDSALTVARRRGIASLTEGDEARLRLGAERLFAWANAFPIVAGRVYAASLLPRGEHALDTARARREALPALQDALLATVLGDAISKRDRAALLAAITPFVDLPDP